MLNAIIVIVVSCVIVILAMIVKFIYEDNREEDRLLDEVLHIDGVDGEK